LDNIQFSDDNLIEYFNNKQYRLSRLDQIIVANGDKACDDSCNAVDFSPRPPRCSVDQGSFDYSDATRIDLSEDGEVDCSTLPSPRPLNCIE
jgi:hypothetical protein